MNSKYKLISLLLFMFIVFVIPGVSASTLVLDSSSYTAGSTATAKMTITGGNEKSQSYTVVWKNSSGFEIPGANDTGTTPSSTVSPLNEFFESFIINSTYISVYGAAINATLIGTNLEGSAESAVVTANEKDLLIKEINITTENFIGGTLGISAKVKNGTETAVTGAICRFDIESIGGLTIVTGIGGISNHAGDVDIDFEIDSSHFEPGVQYISDINCFCSTGNNNKCSDAPEGASGEGKLGFLIDDLNNFILVDKWVNDTGFFSDFVSGSAMYPGVWLENEFGGKTLVEDGPTRINQEDITWSGFNSTISFNATTNGEGFVTGTRAAALCFLINNTFPVEKIITVKQLSFDDDTFEGSFFPEEIDNGEAIFTDRILLRTGIKPSSEDGILKKCTEEFRIPSHLIGGNDWDANFQIEVDGFEQKLEEESDEFSIFGHKVGSSFVDFITVNALNFIQANATEGEFIEVSLNVTTNHPDLAIPFLNRFLMLGNRNLSAGTVRPLETTSTDFPMIESEQGSFLRGGNLPPSLTFLINSGRFRVPFGLRERDLTDVIAMGFSIEFGENGAGVFPFRFDLGALSIPTINIIGQAMELTNATTSLGLNGQAAACSPITYTLTYDNIQSNATLTTEERYIARNCIQDTTNDFYLTCSNIIIEPDIGTGNNASFTTLIPYSPNLATVTAETDTWVYEYDEEGTEGDCKNCGELVDFFSSPSSVFNITTNQTESCRYQDTLIGGADKLLQLDQKQASSLRKAADELEDIANKTGTFKLSVDCPSLVDAGLNMDCDITAQIEDSQTVQKEVDFTCYIQKDGVQYASQNFNQMVTKTPVTLTKEFLVPESFGSSATAILQCEAGYYNLGSRTDTFSDTFETTHSLVALYLRILLGFVALSVMGISVAGIMFYTKNNFESNNTWKIVSFSILTFVSLIFAVVIIGQVTNLIV